MVAFSASRLVCSAIAVINLTTSPICCACARQFADLPVGMLRLKHRRLRDPLDSRTCLPIR